jgi:hypothetical protein
MAEHDTQDVVQASFSAWRAGELVLMGFAARDARGLADARSSDGSLIPLHDIRKALRAGCPHKLAVRIWQ